MGIRQPTNLRERVRKGAEIVLKRDGSVGPLELLDQICLLEPACFQIWKTKNTTDWPIESKFLGSPEKLQNVFRLFQEWANELGLQTLAATYSRTTTRGAESLPITVDNDPVRDTFFRTHFTSPELSQKKVERLKTKLAKPTELAVFLAQRDGRACAECATPTRAGDFVLVEREADICLACADLDHLEFLPAGNATISRRAKKYSSLCAVVLEFNRRYKRYDRVGLLVTNDAIERAESETTADAAERQQQRDRAAARRARHDQELVAAMTDAIGRLFPGCSADEAQSIATHTALRGSGRVGRSAAGRAVDANAVELAVIAWIRHQKTDYDTLLMQGVPRQAARAQIRSKIDECLAQLRRPVR